VVAYPSEKIAAATLGRHRQSHRALLRNLAPLVDAVVVPASRPVQQLAVAVKVAEDLDARFVALCSRDARSASLSAWIGERPGLWWLAIDIPNSYHHPWLNFATSRVTEAKVERLGDLSLKRNLGVLLARLQEWRSVLFLDDDIEEVDIAAVWRGAAALGIESMVGLPVDHFPDNSVVCHVNRYSGEAQKTFISGAALLVDCCQMNSFFPEVYNEDWMFLCRSLAKRKVAATGSARQLEYDPFAEPNRAADEEFGEVLAEGLTNLMHPSPGHKVVPLDMPAAAFEADYWRWFLRARADFTEQIATRIANQPPSDRTYAALLSLKVADDRRSNITAEQCAAYLKTWNHDTADWCERWVRLQRSGTLRKALASLDLVQYAQSPQL
jgi:hypothetical protein